MTLQELELIRKKSRKENIIGIVVLVFSIILLIFCSNSLKFDQIATALALIGFIAGIILISVANAKFSKIKKNFKYKILKAEIEKMYPNIQYYPDRGLDEMFVNSLHLYKKPDRYHSEDMLCGKIMDVGFVCSDVHMEERHVQHTKNGTRVYYETYFQGRIYRFDFNKPFKDTILLVEGMKPGAYGALQKVEMESIDFNKKFKTFCKEKINAFYILTPQLMLALLELEKQNPGVISIIIDSNSVYMAINNRRDSFEISLNRPIDENYLKYYMKDIVSVEQIIDQLNLDDKVFKEIANDIKNI